MGKGFDNRKISFKALLGSLKTRRRDTLNLSASAANTTHNKTSKNKGDMTQVGKFLHYSKKKLVKKMQLKFCQMKIFEKKYDKNFSRTLAPPFYKKINHQHPSHRFFATFRVL